MRTHNAFLAAMMVVLTAGVAFGQDWVANPEDDLWSNPKNWSTGVVPDGGTVNISRNNADVLVDYAADSIGTLQIARGGGNINGVTFTVTGSLTTAGVAFVTRHNSSAELIVDGGAMTTGNVTMGGEWADETSSATIRLINEGTLSTGALTVGSGTGHPTLPTNPGVITQIDILAGSELTTSANATIGTSAGDSLHRIQLGDASGAGTFSQSGATARAMFLRSGSVASDVEFRGHGTVGYNGGLTTNARVVADGFGTDRTLDMTSFSGVTRSFVDNADLVTYTGAVSGWYAVNGGRLELPNITVEAGSPSVRWGDSQASQGMVNSVYTSFTGSVAGQLTIALLAADRAEVPSAPSGVELIGVWDISRTGDFDTATMTFRYDEAALLSGGLSEDDLSIWHYTGGQWVDVFGSIDTTNKLITSTAVTSFSLFAVGAIPEPGSLLLLGAGSLLILSRRRTA